MLSLTYDYAFSVGFKTYYTIRTALLTVLSKVLPFLFSSHGSFPARPYNAVLITGASSGIGRDAAIHLASKGYMVFAGTRKSADFQDLLKQFEQTQKKGFLYSVIIDVADEKSVKAAQEAVADRLRSTNSRLVAVVNNAGILVDGLAEFMPPETVRNVMNVNFTGTVLVSQAFLPLLRDGGKGGRIVNISSIAGFSPTPHMSIYSASKYAVEGFTDALRREVRSQGIFVVSVMPGPVNSAIFDKASHASNAIDADLNDSQKEIIKTKYSAVKMFERSSKSLQQMVVSPLWTSLTIEHAIESPFPKTRYLINLDSYFLYALKCVLPDVMFDFLVLDVAKYMFGALQAKQKKA
ncbi:hypothetical protein MP638_005866 [Amoeboaphelidium occidentale]|nr:hypothetical protein MP638_005866 [Amoeboaphelidium occidentale]